MCLHPISLEVIETFLILSISPFNILSISMILSRRPLYSKLGSFERVPYHVQVHIVDFATSNWCRSIILETLLQILLVE